MSEAPAMSRTPGGSDEFDRRLRMTGRPPATEDDPLAELARLVGQDDPFKRMFPKAAPTRERAEPAFAATPSQTTVASNPPAAVAVDHAVEGFAAFDHDIDDGFAPLDEGAAAQVPPVRRYDPRSYPVEPSPDAWAQGDDSSDEDDSPAAAVQDKPASTGRTLVVLAAVVVLTGGGLAASFLARPSSVSATVAPPTILAVAGPAKVQPPAPASSSDEGQSEPSTLLDKNKSDGTATAKVVDSVEQPVDLSQAVRPAPDAPDASNPFPTPRKVRTLMVRPDGTVLASGPDAPAPAAAAPDVTEASLAFDSHTAIPMPDRSAPPPAAAPDGSTASIPTEMPPAPAPPKVTARAAPPVRTPPAQAATHDDTADAAPAPVKPKPPVSSTRVRPKSKPIEEASLTTVPDTSAPTPGATGNGSYAVQLGAPPSAQEARDASSRLQKKFADALGSYRPAIHEAKSGDKSVFRIRVGGLSQDDAKALCSKLQSSGGACFVVHN